MKNYDEKWLSSISSVKKAKENTLNYKKKHIVKAYCFSNSFKNPIKAFFFQIKEKNKIKSYKTFSVRLKISTLTVKHSTVIADF